MKNWLIVVPARLASQRLPRKPLADIAGKPMIVRVVENLKTLADVGATVVVATDTEEILQVCKNHDILAEMTKVDHPSGTDRCQEVAKAFNKPFILNVQGDEPFIDTEDLIALSRSLELKPSAQIATLVFESSDSTLFENPNAVKAVAGFDGRALYFSRAPIPFPRNKQDDFRFLVHLGTYAFRKEALTKFCTLPQGNLEITEKLEQLRALEHGLEIRLVKARSYCRGIDTPEDLEAARARFKDDH